MHARIYMCLYVCAQPAIYMRVLLSLRKTVIVLHATKDTNTGFDFSTTYKCITTTLTATYHVSNCCHLR